MDILKRFHFPNISIYLISKYGSFSQYIKANILQAKGTSIKRTTSSHKPKGHNILYIERLFLIFEYPYCTLAMSFSTGSCNGPTNGGNNEASTTNNDVTLEAQVDLYLLWALPNLFE